MGLWPYVALKEGIVYKNLSPGAIGIRGLSLAEAIDLAHSTGFGGIDFSIREAAALADERGIDYVRGLFKSAGVLPGQWGLPVAWNKDEQWEQDLQQLPRLAAIGQAVTGITHSMKNMLNALKGGSYMVKVGMAKEDRALLEEGWGIVQQGIESMTMLSKKKMCWK